MADSDSSNKWQAAFFLLIGMVCLAAFVLVTQETTTDEKFYRSLMNDPVSGCQYLAPPKGGITPRLDAEGEHMGCTE